MDDEKEASCEPLSYCGAGVDIEAGKQAVELIKEEVNSTFRPEVLSELGGFGALFSGTLEGYQQPVLVSSVDGVGTKVKVAQMLDRHDSIGVDLVAMCVDDIVTCGAEPLFMLDYLAMAEHPGILEEDEYDLAGFVVGVAEKEGLIDGSRIVPGDVVLGLASSGLHANGFSLARKIFFELNDFDPHDHLKGLAGTLGEELLTATEIYAPVVLRLAREMEVKAVVHITGGGLIDNIPRVLPQNVDAIIDLTTWHPPNIFRIIQDMGEIDEVEMFKTFNMGIGMVVIIGLENFRQAVQVMGLEHYRASRIGEIHKGTGGICLTC
jgi:phosphoribosylformylglycinamidine cyclo-ligase